MKYALFMFCDECNEKAQAAFGNGGVIPPKNWLVRQRPTGEMIFACSAKCANEISKKDGSHSIIMPRKPPGLMLRR